MSETDMEVRTYEDLRHEHKYLYGKVHAARMWLDDIQTELHPTEPEGYELVDPIRIGCMIFRAQQLLHDASVELQRVYGPIAALK